MEARYSSPDVTATELGAFAESMYKVIFRPHSSRGFKRESGLSLLSMVSAAVKSDKAPETVEEILKELTPGQRQAIGDVIHISGVEEDSPTYRERHGAQEISRTLEDIE